MGAATSMGDDRRGARPAPGLGSLSIVVPMYDEEGGVEPLAAALTTFLSAQSARVVEVVLVDDGSTDDTRRRLTDHLSRFEPLARAARVVGHDRNRGLTAALATGLAHARGDLVGWLDSDLTYDPAVLAALAARCDAGADVALASCYHPDGGVEGVGRWRLWLSRLASAGHRLASGHRLHTFTCMVRVWRRDALQRSQPRAGGFLGVAESLHLALRAGMRVEEVPALLRRRRTGSSKMRVLRAGVGHLRLMATALLRRIAPFSRGRRDRAAAPPRARS